MVHDLLPMELSIYWGQWCGQTSCLDISWIQRPTPQGWCLLDTSSHDSGCRTYLPPHDLWPLTPHSQTWGTPHSQSQKWTWSWSLVLRQEHTSQSLTPPRSLSAPTGVGWGEPSVGRSVSMNFDKVWILFTSAHPPNTSSSKGSIF